MMNQPIAMITSTPAMKSPKTPIVLTVGSVVSVAFFGLLGVVVVGGGVGAGWAGASGPKGLPPGEGVGVGTGVGAPDCATASGAAIRSATTAARRVGSARTV
jgi:hypothetical protein